MTLFNQLRTRRVNFEQQWEESAALAWPDYVGSFTYGREIPPGAKRAQFQLDNSASIGSHRFGAICDWLLTPSHMLWSRVQASNPDLMKDPAVKGYFADLTNILWTERYKAEANFIGQNQQNMQGLGVFGNMGMFTDELDNYLDPRESGLRYLATPVGEIYVIQDHQRRVVGFIRHFRLNAQQAKTKFPARVVPVIDAALAISSQHLFDFLHIVRPRTDFDPFEPLSQRGKKYASTYISIQGYCVLEEGGYRTLPLAYGRYMQAPEEDYGRGPTQMILNTLKSSNTLWRSFMRTVTRRGDPTYLVHDTGLIDLKTHSGAIVAGAIGAKGERLVDILPTGEIDFTKDLMEKFEKICDDAYLTGLFKLITGDGKDDMGARQVVEYINERGILLAPTVGRQCTEYLGPLIDRELDILSWLRKLPKMPPVLREARGEYKIVYTSPIARAMQSQESAGYVRTLEFASEAAKATGDPSLLDYFEFDASIPAMGDQNNAPPDWFSSPKAVAAKRKSRAQAAERDRQVKELPGKAAIMKAQAIQTKAQTGGNIGGTLSGVPEGGMPLMPGQ